MAYITINYLEICKWNRFQNLSTDTLMITTQCDKPIRCYLHNDDKLHLSEELAILMLFLALFEYKEEGSFGCFGGGAWILSQAGRERKGGWLSQRRNTVRVAPVIHHITTIKYALLSRATRTDHVYYYCVTDEPPDGETDWRPHGRVRNTDHKATADREWISNVAFMKWNI